MIEVKKIGSVLPVDQNGHVVSKSSKDKIVHPWLEPVDMLKEAYIKNYGDKLHSVYIRGSIAKGAAIEGLSDIDSMAVIYESEHNFTKEWVNDFNDKLKRLYPSVNGVEVVLIPYENLVDLSNKEYTWKRFAIKTQAACVYGEDLQDTLPDFRLGPDCIAHAYNLEKEINILLRQLEELSPQSIRVKCSWIMKRVLRTGYEMVMQRERGYTRDLYSCYEGFARHYPEKSNDMWRALELALNPTPDKEELGAYLKSFGVWLADEAKKVDFES